MPTCHNQYLVSDMFMDIQSDFERYLRHSGLNENCSFWRKIFVFFRSPAFLVICNHRYGFWVNKRFEKRKGHPVYHLLKSFYFAAKFIGVCISKIDILVTADIGSGLFLSNKGNMVLGISKMGKGCTIFNKVTIGGGQDRSLPEFGDSVAIGSNSVIYGQTKIGNGVIALPFTIISRSIPANIVIGGNPCKIISKDVSSWAKSNLSKM